MKLGIGGHQRGFQGKTDQWLTPPDLLALLGKFDLDPCSPIDRPWDTATRHYTAEDDGLSLPWYGRVWLNPPYGPETRKWLKKLADHGEGMAIIFARTETEMFFSQIWERASALLFLKGRLHFHRVDGTRAAANAGGPSVLVAYGHSDALCLANTHIPGRYVGLRQGAAA